MTSRELKKLRRAVGLTQRQLANLAGLARGEAGRVTITRWETGARKITEPMGRFLKLLLANPPPPPS